MNIKNDILLIYEVRGIMSNKLKATKKKMASLGLKKDEGGDYENIDPSEKNKSKYKPVKKEPK